MTSFNTQQGKDTGYKLQFETDDKEKFLYMQECARKCVDNKHGDSCGGCSNEDDSVCKCFHVKKVERKYTDTMRGYLYAKTGKFPPDTYIAEEYYCWGVGPEIEPCKCGGDRSACDFYWPNGKSKNIYDEKGRNKYDN